MVRKVVRPAITSVPNELPRSPTLKKRSIAASIPPFPFPDAHAARLTLSFTRAPTARRPPTQAHERPKTNHHMRKNRNRQISTRGDGKSDVSSETAGQKGGCASSTASGRQLRRLGSRRLRARGNALAPRAPPLALAGGLLRHLPEQDEADDEQHGNAKDAVAA